MSDPVAQPARSDQGKRVAPRFTTRYYQWMVTWAVLVAIAGVEMAVFDWPRGLTIGPITVEDWSARDERRTTVSREQW